MRCQKAFVDQNGHPNETFRWPKYLRFDPLPDLRYARIATKGGPAGPAGAIPHSHPEKSFLNTNGVTKPIELVDVNLPFPVQFPLLAGPRAVSFPNMRITRTEVAGAT